MRFFDNDVLGIPVKQFITGAILPRPRDIVFFVRSALDQAVNAGHITIEADDLLAAEKQYSRYALDSLVVEGLTEIERLEDERSRIVVTDPTIAGGNQPYHFAAGRNFSESDAEKYLASYTSASEQLAMAAIGTIFLDLKHRGHIVDRCAILQASGRTLPPISKILVAHPLVHTAEGELFRRVFWTAAEHLNLKVIGIRERDLDACAESTFGTLAVQVKRRDRRAGKIFGATLDY